MGPFVKRAKETNERNDIPKLKENESGKCEENLNEKWFRDMNIFGSFITRKIFFYLFLRDSILHHHHIPLQIKILKRNLYQHFGRKNSVHLRDSGMQETMLRRYKESRENVTFQWCSRNMSNF